LSGLVLFEHQVAFRQCAISSKDHKISNHMDVEVRGKHQNDVLSPSLVKTIQQNIMREIGASVITERLAKRKLDALGYIKSHSCFINDPERMERICSKLLLTKSLEHVKAIEDEEAVHNKKEEEGELKILLPEALAMYMGIKGGEKPPRKLTKKHISAILLLCFNLCVSGNKDKMIAALDEVSAANPSKLTS
jgi:hypothetical protein